MITFAELPVQDVVALRILPHLSLLETWNLRSLCKSFYHAVFYYISYVLKEIDIKSCTWGDFYPALSNIFKKAAKLRLLSIAIDVPDQHQNSMIERCLTSLPLSNPTLSELKLHRVSFQNRETLLCLSKVSSSLRLLHIVQVKWLFDDLQILLENTTSLVEFVCSGTDISRSFVNTIATQSQLQVLKVSFSFNQKS